MKKLVITTAIVLTITSNADARDRFHNLRPSEPTIEVNLGALQYLQPDNFGKIDASVRPEKTVKRPVKAAQGTENTPVLAKPMAAKPAPKKPAAATSKIVNIKTPVPTLTQPEIAPAKPELTLPKPTPLKQLTPIKPLPKIVPELPKAEDKNSTPLEFPKLSAPKIEPLKPIAPISLPKPTPSAKPMAAPKTPPAPAKMPELKMPELKAPQPKPELVMPENLPAPTMPIAKMPAPQAELPKLMPIAPIAPIAAPVAPASTKPNAATNEVVLPPLFPANATKTAATTPAPQAKEVALPPLKNLFNDNASDSKKDEVLEMPKLPVADALVPPPPPPAPAAAKPASADLPNIPAPDISSVQVKPNVPKAQPLPQPPNTDVNLTFNFNETETELPLSEQPKLEQVASQLKQDASLALTVNAYASGTAEQTSQAKRTSLARALSVRRFMLEHNVKSNQIIIRPYGNESGNGVPDRVDIKMGKKIGA